MSVIEGFAEEVFSWGGTSFPLFRKGEGPGVILLHELPGLTHETVDFATWISLFGSNPGKNSYPTYGVPSAATVGIDP